MIRVGDAAHGPGVSGGGPRRRSATRSCAATSATPPTSSAASARSSSARPPTGSSCARPAARSRRTCSRHLDTYLEQFEENCTRAGGHVHWARDADEANRIVVDIIRSHGESEVIKVKTMTSDETRLNVALEAAGIAPYETDLADLIIQLGDDRPSHIVVPALHRNRAEIREHLPADDAASSELGGEPEDLTARGAAVPAREVPARPGRVQRRQLPDRRHRRRLRRRVGRQRPDVPDAAAGADHAGRDREGGARARGSRGLPAAAAALGDRRADEPVQHDLDRRDRRATAPRSSTSSCSTTAARRCSPTSESRETLHCIRCARLSERVPGLPADRRPCLRVDLQRSDRRDPHAAAAGRWSIRSRCRMLRRCAARATRCARSRSTFPEILIHLRRRIVEERRRATASGWR